MAFSVTLLWLIQIASIHSIVSDFWPLIARSAECREKLICRAPSGVSINYGAREELMSPQTYDRA